MIDLSAFKQPIEHSIRNATTQKEELESSGYFAHKMDDNGLRKAFNLKEKQLNAVDFFLIDHNSVTFIELSDLTQYIIDCIKAESILKEDVQTFSKLLNKKRNPAEKIFSKKIWAEIIAEFKNKLHGAIAVMERTQYTVQQRF